MGKKNLMEKGQGANGDGGFDMLTHLGTAAGNGGEEEEMQRGAVGQIKLEPAEDFAFHSQQLMLSVGVIH